MSTEKKYIGDLFICRRWYVLISLVSALFFLAFFFKVIYYPAQVAGMALVTFTVMDYLLLFVVRGTITGQRQMSPRFSIGDENEVVVSIENRYPYKMRGFIIDELPVQFQNRTFNFELSLSRRIVNSKTYKLRPLSRGEYTFGNLLCYAISPLGLLQRRIKLEGECMVKVYPAFLQLKKTQFQMIATSANTVPGLKKLRRLGHSLEFEKIKDYVPGDDVRTINWKATARKNALMVNTFTDARQQQIYCVIDKGRNMKMPFEGLTLLDHSINACLALLNVALLRQDRAGLITFSNKVNDIVAADKRHNQLFVLLETLYKQQTDFKESDYEALWVKIHKSLTQRCLVLFFTNFETYSSLERQLPYLKQIARNHLTCVIFFENTLLKELHENTPDDLEGIYVKTIADQFAYEKRQIVKELKAHGILSILTSPERLNIDVINKYLELKARQMA